MIPDKYHNHYKALEIYTGYFDSLDIMILFPYPSNVVITRDYCIHANDYEQIYYPSGTLQEQQNIKFTKCKFCYCKGLPTGTPKIINKKI